ncbi:hypothetical protein K2O51_22760 [Cupriavidus pinatubonensis]|uniref:hypothetical protein n=1 Tax=Cupriavidus pinatubonensis TaxID=248026 RepID=UPI00112BB6C9|nr:hypothetical protein [Cupriavidus pinatubonensis]QYY30197.1 hypothetical protein K2O51_22760 [Cupriavidus pinatubonensis]TPQ34976.1 hypothetical protein C2U69_21545 [Cupriavidus pinatubonensis]
MTPQQPRVPATLRLQDRKRMLALAALASAGMALSTAWRPAHAADEMVIRTMGPVSYVCGGIAEDERKALADLEKNFNMGILFTQGSNGEFLSDVAVRLLRDEQEIATFRAAGPRCLIRAPEGSYNIEASYKGQTKTIKIGTGSRDAQLRW